ncbi:hypothetical protein Vretimale_5582, partial [Volvox reticuliferus]
MGYEIKKLGEPRIHKPKFLQHVVTHIDYQPNRTSHTGPSPCRGVGPKPSLYPPLFPFMMTYFESVPPTPGPLLHEPTHGQKLRQQRRQVPRCIRSNGIRGSGD